MKKFLAMAILAVGIFAVQISAAKAADIYVGTYSSGYKAYLMTETIQIQRRDYMDYSCRVKAVSGNDIIYVDYTFWEDRQRRLIEHYKDSSGNTGMFTVADSNGHPVPYNIDSYVAERFY